MSTSGRYAVARIGTSPVVGENAPAGTPVKGLQEWSVEESADPLDASDGEIAYRNTDAGMPGCRITIRMVQKIQLGPIAILRTGAVLQKVALYYNRLDTAELGWFFPYAVVLSVSNPVRVRGQREATIVLESKGRYYDPYLSAGSDIADLLADTYPDPDA